MMIKALQIWLIQSKVNGYVHCAFTSRKQAEQWITEYMRRTNSYPECDYHVVERYMFEKWDEVL